MATSMPAAAPRAKGVEGREDAGRGRCRRRRDEGEMRVRFSTPGGLSSDKKNGRAHCKERARWGEECSSPLRLEIEAHAELYLTLAEERAVGPGCGSEEGGEGQGRARERVE